MSEMIPNRDRDDRDAHDDDDDSSPPQSGEQLPLELRPEPEWDFVEAMHDAPPGAFGETFDPDLDAPRMGAQLQRVFNVMRDGSWRTYYEIAAITGDPVQSVSARVRDLKKPRFGSRTIERRRRGTGGTWEYRLVVDGPMANEEGPQ
jgi:hypothetical protein